MERTETISPFSDAPAFREVANTRGISGLALISFFRTPHPTMPDFVVPAADIHDLISYFGTLHD